MATTTKKTATSKAKSKAVPTKVATPSKAVEPKVAPKKTSQYQSLRKWNLGFGALLALQAVAIIVIGGSQTVPITTNYLATDALASDAAGHQVLAVATRHLADVRLSWMVAKFLLIFAAVFLLAATLWRGKYEAWLERGVNKLRWAGFGLGGGVMATTVAVLGGVSDISSMLLIFGVVALSGLCALAASLMGSERRLRRLLIVGGLAGAVIAWLSIFISAGGAALYDGSLPAFVCYMYVSMLLFTGAIGLASYFRLKGRGKWADTVYAERMFMVLGFLAASVLAWQIFAGTLL
jgi:hypothetical protein